MSTILAKLCIETLTQIDFKQVQGEVGQNVLMYCKYSERKRMCCMYTWLILWSKSNWLQVWVQCQVGKDVWALIYWYINLQRKRMYLVNPVVQIELTTSVSTMPSGEGCAASVLTWVVTSPLQCTAIHWYNSLWVVTSPPSMHYTTLAMHWCYTLVQYTAPEWLPPPLHSLHALLALLYVCIINFTWVVTSPLAMHCYTCVELLHIDILQCTRVVTSPFAMHCYTL